MPVDIVVGGQGGDEGKGRIAAHLALHGTHGGTYDAIVRVSKPQAGHTIHHNGKRIGLVTLPCGALCCDARVLIGRGAYISVTKLQQEIETANLDPRRLGVDRYATLVSDEHVAEETSNARLINAIGSVGTGAGPATRDKVMRKPNVRFAKDAPQLAPYLTDSVREIRELLRANAAILIEGDQGFKLSLIHGEFPFVTSDDTAAATHLGKAGIGPREIRDVYAIFKPYVTRVSTGPLADEIFDRNILEWGHTAGGESGTVSNRLRRMGWFEWDNAREAVFINSANKLCFTHMDWNHFGTPQAGEKITPHARAFLQEVEEKLCREYPHPSIALLSYGPHPKDITEYHKIL